MNVHSECLELDGNINTSVISKKLEKLLCLANKHGPRFCRRFW